MLDRFARTPFFPFITLAVQHFANVQKRFQFRLRAVVKMDPLAARQRADKAFGKLFITKAHGIQCKIAAFHLMKIGRTEKIYRAAANLAFFSVQLLTSSARFHDLQFPVVMPVKRPKSVDRSFFDRYPVGVKKAALIHKIGSSHRFCLRPLLSNRILSIGIITSFYVKIKEKPKFCDIFSCFQHVFFMKIWYYITVNNANIPFRVGYSNKYYVRCFL